MALRRGHLECGANCWSDAVTSSQHVYEVRPRKDKRGVDLISDALPFGRLWYEQASDAVEWAKFYSRSHDGDAHRQQKMRGYEAHRAAAQMSSSTTLTVRSQCLTLPLTYKDATRCPQRTRLENKL